MHIKRSAMGSPFLATIIAGLLTCHIITLTSLPTSSAERQKRNQLPCTHPLRIIFPEDFTHCGSACQYTTWSSWRKVRNSEVSVPVIQCPSGRAYTDQRTRIASGSGCTEPLRETRTICLPTQEERLILHLGLGGSGNNYRSFYRNAVPSSLDSYRAGTLEPARFKRQLQAQCGRTNQICHSLTRNGKRSVMSPNKETPIKEVIRTDLNPIPFDWLEHGPSLRTKRQTRLCRNQDTQHVLFVLDTSGSISRSKFNQVKNAVRKLPALFCRQVKFAVVTFDSYINLEFCFNCFDNTYQGRFDASFAINNIAYRGGSTHTGATARCVCRELLHPRCGINAFPDCLDVVFITDGHSNDPTLEICDEIRCLHGRSGVATYAIGISNSATPSYNRTELNCINDYSDDASAFEFESFVAFERAIQNIVDRLRNAAQNSPESCAGRDGEIRLPQAG